MENTIISEGKTNSLVLPAASGLLIGVVTCVFIPVAGLILLAFAVSLFLTTTPVGPVIYIFFLCSWAGFFFLCVFFFFFFSPPPDINFFFSARFSEKFFFFWGKSQKKKKFLGGR